MKISYEVLGKFERLNQQVDDLIACEDNTDSSEYENTITVFEQLIIYYENISCSLRDFQGHYNGAKKTAIESSRKGTYESIMNRVKERATESLKREYKYYDLIK